MPMPGLKTFKGLGRRSSNNAAPAQVTSPSPGFRVIPRAEAGRQSASDDQMLSNSERQHAKVEDKVKPVFPQRISSKAVFTPDGRPNDGPPVPRHSEAPSSSTLASAKHLSRPLHHISSTVKPSLRERARSSKELPYLPNMADMGDDLSTMLHHTKSDTLPPLTSSISSLPRHGRSRSNLSPSSVSSLTPPAPPAHRTCLSSSTDLLGRDQSAPPQPPPHKSCPALYNLATAPSGQDRPPSTDSPLCRSESAESFVRSDAAVDADAKMVRNSVLALREAQTTGAPSLSSHGHPDISSLPIVQSNPPSSSTSLQSPSLSSSTSSGQIAVNVHKTTREPDLCTKNPSYLPRNHDTPRPTAPDVAEDSDDSDDEPLGNCLLNMTIDSSPLSMLLESNGTASSLRTGPGGTDDSPLPASTGTGPARLGNGHDKALYRSASSDLTATRSAAYLSTKSSTGKQLVPSRPSIDQSRSRTNQSSQSAPLLAHSPSPEPDTKSKSSDDDYDDDVPLAVLHAHGFSSRGRSPDPKANQNPSTGNSGRMMSSSNGLGTGNGRSSLPPFARRLPEDPYGNPVNAMNDPSEALAMQRPLMTFPGQSPVPGLPPGGLVGVIAEEERAKSFRRAAGAGQSVSFQSQLNPLAMIPSMSMGMHGPMTMSALTPMASPQMQSMNEQSQINHELIRIVQQQNMLLQQLTAQVQQMSTASSIYAESQVGLGSLRSTASVVSRRMTSQAFRTRSMVHTDNLPYPDNRARTMSMVHTAPAFPSSWAIASDSMSGAASVRGLDTGYAASVAPSERSNIGQPSRYRPVSSVMLKDDNGPSSASFGQRASSLSQPPILPLDDSLETTKKKKIGFFSSVINARAKPNEAPEEEDWGSFVQKRRSIMQIPNH